MWLECGGRRGPALHPALALRVRILPGKLKINSSVHMCKATAKAGFLKGRFGGERAVGIFASLS